MSIPIESYIQLHFKQKTAKQMAVRQSWHISVLDHNFAYQSFDWGAIIFIYTYLYIFYPKRCN